jgi:parallel beta-helix repeat protein
MHDPTRSSTVTQGLFRITGDRTTLVGNTARGGRIGFLVFGKSNTLRHNTASGQRVLGSGTTCTYVRGAIGFSVYGAHHTLEGNEASDGSVDPSCLRDRGNIPSGFEIGVDSSLTLPGSDAEEKQERRTTTRVTLEGNTATGYGFGGRGFNAFGRSVSLVRNTARGNVDGFFVVGKNTVEDNEASSNSGSGYLLASGVKAARNVAVDNIGDGFHICCSKAKIRLVDSRAERNGKNGIGIFSADGNLIQRNVVRDNGRDGISVQPNPRPSRRNKVLGNVVSGHSAGFFDLRDEQPCGTNTWTDNTFATKSPECLQ